MRQYRGQVKGVDTPKARWAYGDKFEVGGRGFIVPDDAWLDSKAMVTAEGLYGFIEVIPETLGRNTGLKDKDGVEVYYGDVVEAKSTFDHEIITGVVGFSDASFMIKNGCITCYRWMDYNLKVIGNIHDTPELLEAKDGKSKS